MATFAELDELARSLPGVEARLTSAGRPEYRVRDKSFLLLREPRPDAVDAETGERMDDVLMFRTPGLAVKDDLLADPSLPLFTTPHFRGWPAVLLRVRDLPGVPRDRLRELVFLAWRAQAPKRLVREAEAAGWR